MDYASPLHQRPREDPVRGIDPHIPKTYVWTHITLFQKKKIKKNGPKVAITIRSLCPLSNAPKGGSFGSNCDCNIGPFSTAITIIHPRQRRNHNYWPIWKKSKSKLKFPPFFSDPTPKINFFGDQLFFPKNTFYGGYSGMDFWGFCAHILGFRATLSRKSAKSFVSTAPLSATVAPLF